MTLWLLHNHYAFIPLDYLGDSPNSLKLDVLHQLPQSSNTFG